MTKRLCTIPGCDRPYEARGMCHGHYAYWRRTGSTPTGPLENRDPAFRFWSKVTKTDTCWLWRGATDGGGRYGAIQYEGRVQRAHRVSLKLAGIPVPDNKDVDHLCRVTLCVRPSHLDVVDARKATCPKGHPYDGDNTYVPPSGGRVCRTCQRATGAERQRRYRARKKAAG